MSARQGAAQKYHYNFLFGLHTKAPNYIIRPHPLDRDAVWLPVSASVFPLPILPTLLLVVQRQHSEAKMTVFAVLSIIYSIAFRLALDALLQRVPFR